MAGTMTFLSILKQKTHRGLIGPASQCSHHNAAMTQARSNHTSAVPKSYITPTRAIHQPCQRCNRCAQRSNRCAQRFNRCDATRFCFQRIIRCTHSSAFSNHCAGPPHKNSASYQIGRLWPPTQVQGIRKMLSSIHGANEKCHMPLIIGTGRSSSS